MADNNKLSSSRISFTLPISCQICLGKVKQPVVCPNQHVFCSPCMDVWLQRNQQCPSCRVPISEDNPCKKLLGGLNHGEEDQEKSFSQSKDLRRSRLELLCKDYEDEIERLQMDNDSLTQQNTLLEKQVNAYSESRVKEAEDDCSKQKVSSSSNTGPDVNMLMVLTKKLQDATNLYERVKKDMDKLKQENANAKDENAALSRENQRLRMEVVGRSPRKFGRYTVATLETKVEQYEKENKQLQKAMERSDAYIEELEKELENFRKKSSLMDMCVRCKMTMKCNPRVDCQITNNTDEKQNFHNNVEAKVFPNSKISSLSFSEKHKEQREKELGIQSRSGTSECKMDDEKKSVTTISFYGKKPVQNSDGYKTASNHLGNKGQISTKTQSPIKGCDISSFELEMPSPSSSVSNSVSRMTLENDFSNLGNDSTLTNEAEYIEDSLPKATHTGSAKKRLKFESTSPDMTNKRNLNEGNSRRGNNSNKQVTFNRNVSIKNMVKTKNALNDSLLDVTLPSDTSELDILNDIKTKASSFTDDTFDIDNSMNSDIMECMDLFDGAERRLVQAKGHTSHAKPATTSSVLQDTSVEIPSSSSDISDLWKTKGSFDPNSLKKTHPLPSQSNHFPSANQALNLPDSQMNRNNMLTNSAPASSISTNTPSLHSTKPDVQFRNLTGDCFSQNYPHSTSLNTYASSSKCNDFNYFPPGTTLPSTQTGFSYTENHNRMPDSLYSSQPPRPASTSTLQGMMSRLQEFETENRRPLSTPGAAFSEFRPESSSNVMCNNFGSISLPSNVPYSTSNFITEPGTRGPKASGSYAANTHGGNTGFSVSSSNFTPGNLPVSGLPGGYQPSSGFPTGFPSGSNGLSQPSIGLGNDINLGITPGFGSDIGSNVYGLGFTQ